MRVSSLVAQIQSALAFYFKSLGCLEPAKHDIFVLTVDCSQKKNGREDFSSCLSFGEPVSHRVCCYENAPVPDKLCSGSSFSWVCTAHSSPSCYSEMKNASKNLPNFCGDGT